ncbi:thioredoxin-dependent thiol peroxidase [Chryseobacterium koreense]
MLKIGDKIPDFELQNQDGKPVKSSKLFGKKLVIFFYPKANTPTCTVEACNINDNISKLKKAGFQIVGISADSVKRQKSFHEKFSFKYDLLSDENHEVIEKFGVWQEKNTFGKTYMGIVRTTFLFNENGICTGVISDVKSKIASEQILQTV